eukprot:gene7257-14800_t
MNLQLCNAYIIFSLGFAFHVELLNSKGNLSTNVFARTQQPNTASLKGEVTNCLTKKHILRDYVCNPGIFPTILNDSNFRKFNYRSELLTNLSFWFDLTQFDLSGRSYEMNDLNSIRHYHQLALLYQDDIVRNPRPRGCCCCQDKSSFVLKGIPCCDARILLRRINFHAMYTRFGSWKYLATLKQEIMFSLKWLWQVVDTKVPSAYYKLTDHRSQIRNYVFDVIRSTVPRLELDEAFESKDSVAHAVKNQLSTLMSEYGYEILVALVTDISPDPTVKHAMNEINASMRLREAAKEKAEAEKILQVKSAEADAESKYLSGLGVARQRKAICDGLKDTVSEFSSQVPGASPTDVMDLLLLTQYFDMMKDVGGKRKSNSAIFIPHGPHAIQDLREQLSASFNKGLGKST